MESKNIKEVFLAEALGHSNACDIRLAENTIILPKGSMIDARMIGRLAAQGIDRIAVYRKPRISILVIGQGLISPGIPPASGKSYDFSIAELKALLETKRIRPVFVRQLKAEPKMLRRMIPFAVNQSDMIILVIKEIGQGLVRIRRLLEDLHVKIIFTEKKLGSAKMRIAAGKGKKTVFCLSYNSDHIFDSFYKFIHPTIQAFMGCANSKDIVCGVS